MLRDCVYKVNIKTEDFKFKFVFVLDELINKAKFMSVFAGLKLQFHANCNFSCRKSPI